MFSANDLCFCLTFFGYKTVYLCSMYCTVHRVHRLIYYTHFPAFPFFTNSFEITSISCACEFTNTEQKIQKFLYQNTGMVQIQMQANTHKKKKENERES